jgi:hypothetical protein
MKTEKLSLLVGGAIEEFLNSLPQPLKLNEMRVMKENNYTKFRSLLSDPEKYGDEILQILRINMKQLGISKKAFD